MVIPDVQHTPSEVYIYQSCSMYQQSKTKSGNLIVATIFLLCPINFCMADFVILYFFHV